ncbi:FAD-dependent oxidoreductase [Amaricoccus macauensis]|uniref:FAD-dependent oxidoreductase n=1 Tax=Amaricoccus macauensis TaxID=57001 RepID=UPI003C7BE8BB
MTDQSPDLAKGVPLADLTEGRPFGGTFEEKSVILVKQGAHVMALSGNCTHAGAPLKNGIVAEGEIRCPWHHARFSVETGEATAAPGFEPLGCYVTEVSDGIVRVTGKRDPAPTRARQLKEGPVVIVGGGAGGHALADGLARAGSGRDVILLMAEDEPPYDRTLVSKQVLAGKMDAGDARLPEPGLGRGPGIDLRTGTRVASIDRAARTVVTESGDRIGYGTLVLATGAAPKQLPIDGLDHPNAFTLRSLEDTRHLIAKAESAKRAVILGSSFIGLEAAASLVARELEVTVVAQDEVPLEKVLGAEAGKFVQGLHEDKGVTFKLGQSIKSYDGSRVVLEDDSTLEADLLVVGTGVAPRTQLAEAAGLEIDDDLGGVRVDGQLRTSDPAIRAIGDIAAYPDPRLGKRIRVEHWVHAERQGQHLAALLLSDTDDEFYDTPFFWTGHYGTQMRYLGHAGSEAQAVPTETVDKDGFEVRFMAGDEMEALLTCKRDVDALETEAKWDGEGEKAAAH